jgi:hypothetical protein
MRYFALALAFASVIIPLNSPQRPQAKTLDKNLNVKKPLNNHPVPDRENTKYELNDRDMIKFFVFTMLTFKVIKNLNKFIPEIPIPSNLVSSLIATDIVAAAAAYKVPQPNPLNSRKETTNKNPHPHSIKQLNLLQISEDSSR